MSLQHIDTVEQVSQNTVRVYFPARLVTDSAFPFRPGDRFVARTLRHEAVVLTPPEATVERLELPPIRDDILDNTTNHATQ